MIGELRARTSVSLVGGGGEPVSAIVTSNWQDSFVAAAAPGQDQVTIRATFDVDIGGFSTSSLPNQVAYGLHNVDYAIGGGGVVEAEQERCVALGTTLSSFDPCAGQLPLVPGDNLFTAEFSVPVGAQTDFLFSAISGSFVSSLAFGDLFVAAVATSRAYFEVLTPGASLTWASGYDYQLGSPSPIPEPGTWALLVTALIGLAARGRMRALGEAPTV